MEPVKPLPRPFYVTVDEGGGAITLEFNENQTDKVCEWADNLNLLKASPLLLAACKRLLHHVETGGKLSDGQEDPRISKSIKLAREALEQAKP